MHIILEIQKSADNGNTFVSKRQVHSHNCGLDNASTIFKWMKIIDNNFFYYNYYHFRDPSTLLTENNTIMIIQTIIFYFRMLTVTISRIRVSYLLITRAAFYLS